MRRRVGLVTAVDRANGVVSGVVEGVPVTATYISGRDEPYPLGEAMFSGGGTTPWTCLHAIGHRERLFRDDFVSVTAGNRYGDTDWSLGQSDGTASAAGATGVASGAVRITAPNAGTVSVIGMLEKDASSMVAPSGNNAYLLSARMRPIDDYTNTFPTLGWGLFADVATSPYATVSGGGSSGFAITTCYDNTTTADEVLPLGIFATGTWNIYEIMWASDFVAGWVDGNGPYVLTTGVPTTSMRPGVGALTSALTQYRVEVDWVEGSIVTTDYTPR